MMIFTLLLFHTFSYSLTPLSECNKARITQYYGYEEGGYCSFGPQSNVITKNFMFSGAANEEFYANGTKCGICYEMIGPSGIVRFRIDNRCPIKGNEEMCSGDMIHFDLSDNTYRQIQSYGGTPNVTLRMVACDYTQPLGVLIVNGSNEWHMRMVVIEHTLGVKEFEIKDSEMDSFVKLKRLNYNVWVFERYNQQGEMIKLKFPLTAKIYSINNDYVFVNNIMYTVDKVHRAEKNFPVPQNTYFNFETLEKLSTEPKKEKCCILWDDYTVIYKNGFIEGAYKSIPYEKEIDVNYKVNPFAGDSCIKIELLGWEVIQFGLNYPARADQYTHVHFALKTEHECKNCFLLRGSHTEFDGIYLSTDKPNKWKEFSVSFTDLHIENNTYWGFWGENIGDDTHVFYLDEIYLVKNEQAPDASQCWIGIDSPDNSEKPNGSQNPQNSCENLLIVLFIVMIVLLM